ncbi:MAG: DegT/DnrJ/EryC1/StrS family aminotransferase, partial [Verrucomicrobia bacterium]|nr:DegT/DnrJ/EryC1/StrS family aminotransferase [Verrucomicrobiota bacterium]
MIPYLDLKAQYDSIREELNAAAVRVLASTHYVLGEEVSLFEKEFAAYTHTQHAVGLNSGTSALHLALLALGVKPGDEVITVPFTFIATASAIVYAQATPVFVDVTPDTLTMDPAALERAITPRTKAIIPVHIHGQMADMTAIMTIANRHGIPVIEDAAQAHGATDQGRAAGSVGAIGCFSFYPGKNLGACGEGGALVTNDPTLAATVRCLRDWGQTQRYHHDLLGFNYRMDGLQGAFLRVKLRKLEEWTEGRRAAAARYEQLLAGLPVGRPVEASERRHVYHVYAIRTARRAEAQDRLNRAQIGNGIHYPIP